MRVLHVAAECAPWAKVGGLADVTGALPAALSAVGVDAALVLPLYREVRERGIEGEPVAGPFPVRLGGRAWPVTLRRATHPEGFPVVLLECDELYDREGIYVDPGTREPFPDDLERFGVLCRGALWAAQVLGRWDLLHAHDAHAAAAVAMLAAGYRHTPLEWTRSVLSLHNAGYQGLHPLAAAATLELPLGDTRPGGPAEFWGRLNLLKAGICAADGLHTVSETYAREIVSGPEFGFGLEGVLRERADRLVGIPNGIDTRAWDPSRDPHLPARYDAADRSGKAECKRAVHRLAGWDESDLSRPLLAVVSRLVDQKGPDLVLEALPALLDSGARLVVLGAGSREYEDAFTRAAASRPDGIWTRIGFDEPLAHRIEAGADVFLMPSRYEPCGLNQMYSMRYGTVPVVRATGGLADTVLEWDPTTGRGTGFRFEAPTSEALLAATARALETYRDPHAWARLVWNGMARDFSWEGAAARYKDWYEGVGRG
ncbi:glycogen synthase GlgA [Myxococcota bacterium]|nr:glycogen synthase GlgA [Myxococcota bacterium]